jgi:hypothetical protein
MADFAQNFKSLKDNKVIPDIDESAIPQNVRDVISTLTPEEIKALGRIAQATGSHVTLHNTEYHFAVCGL